MENIVPAWTKVLRPTGIPVRAGDVDRFEHLLQFPLPKEYKTFILQVNGGKITLNHEFYVAGIDDAISVNALFPLTKPFPSMGIVEARQLQDSCRLGPRQMLRIGDDGGIGFFYLLIGDPDNGEVYFAYKDDIPLLEGDYYSSGAALPEAFKKVTPTFTALATLILTYAEDIGEF